MKKKYVLIICLMIIVIGKVSALHKNVNAQLVSIAYYEGGKTAFIESYVYYQDSLYSIINIDWNDSYLNCDIPKYFSKWDLHYENFKKYLFKDRYKPIPFTNKVLRYSIVDCNVSFTFFKCESTSDNVRFMLEKMDVFSSQFVYITKVNSYNKHTKVKSLPIIDQYFNDVFSCLHKYYRCCKDQWRSECGN